MVKALLLYGHRHAWAVSLYLGVEVATEVIVQLDILPHGGYSEEGKTREDESPKAEAKALFHLRIKCVKLRVVAISCIRLQRYKN